MKRILITLFLTAFIVVAKAQQTTPSDHYLVHQYLVNPAAAGLNGTNVFLNYRKQWAGFTGAPETQILAIDGSILREKIGLGLMIVNDQVNILGSTGVLSTFSYRTKFSDTHFLHFGLSAGINQNRILFDKIIASDLAEVQVFQNNQNATSFDAAAGLYYELGKFKLGLSSSHLFAERYYYENNFTANNLSYQNIRHYLVNAQYRFDIAKGKWGIMPSAQVRVAQGLAPLVEGAVTGFYKKSAWITLRYANKVGYTIAIGGVIAKNIVAGYAYTLSNNELGSFNQGTHDILLGFRLGNKNSGSVTSQKELDELRNKNNELFEKTDYLNSQNEQLRKELEEQKRTLKESIYGLDSLKKHMMENQPELKKIIEENQEKINKLPFQTKNESGSAQETKGKKSSNDNVKESKESTSDDEKIDMGKIYVVIGASKSLEFLKDFQKIVLREYGEETKVVRGPNDSWYFAYTKIFDDYDEAHVERDRCEKMDKKAIFVGNPWCFITKK